MRARPRTRARGSAPFDEGVAAFEAALPTARLGVWRVREGGHRVPADADFLAAAADFAGGGPLPSRSAP